MKAFPLWRLQYGASSMDSSAFYTSLFRHLTKFARSWHFSMLHPLFISSFITVCVCVHMGMCGMLPHTCGGQRVSFARYVYSRDEGLSHLVTKTFIH